jgi:hypothetical protein
MRSGRDRKRGLYGKFLVERADGSSDPGEKHEKCAYFVLDLKHDQFAGVALSAYAEACSAEFPALANDLRALVHGDRSPLRKIRRSRALEPGQEGT